MDIAASALILFFLLLPGLILQRAYTKGFWRWNSPTSVQPVAEQILSGVFAAGLLHLLWASSFAREGRPADLDALVMLLLGSYGHEEQHFERALHSVTRHAGPVAGYFISLYVFAAVVGLLGHFLVRHFGLDRRFKLLRFSNEWFYLLRGEVWEFAEERPRAAQEVEMVRLTATVAHGDQIYAYRGLVSDFFFDRAGNLDRLLLKFVHRRLLGAARVPAAGAPESPPADSDAEAAADADGGDIYQPLDADYLLLRYSEVSALNVAYFTLEAEAA